MSPKKSVGGTASGRHRPGARQVYREVAALAISALISENAVAGAGELSESTPQRGITDALVVD